MNHLMIDTETLGNGPDAAIFAIGAVFFDPFTGSWASSLRNSSTRWIQNATAEPSMQPPLYGGPDNPWRPDPACATQREQSLRQ